MKKEKEDTRRDNFTVGTTLQYRTSTLKKNVGNEWNLMDVGWAVRRGEILFFWSYVDF